MACIDYNIFKDEIKDLEELLQMCMHVKYSLNESIEKITEIKERSLSLPFISNELSEEAEKLEKCKTALQETAEAVTETVSQYQNSIVREIARIDDFFIPLSWESE